MLKYRFRPGCCPEHVFASHADRTRARLVGRLALIGLIAALVAGPAGAIPLLANGDFETGDFTGWTIADLPGSSGTFFIDDNSDGATPLAGAPTVGPAGGVFYAVSDQLGSGTHALIQDFSVPGTAVSVTLSFEMFVNDYGTGAFVDPAGLDHTGNPNQHARVDVLLAGAGDFDTGAGVLANFYIGVDTGTDPNDYTAYVFDITGLVGAGGTFRLRFAETDNQNFLSQGVDNVGIDFVSVPEPSTFLLIAAGLVTLAGDRRRRRC